MRTVFLLLLTMLLQCQSLLPSQWVIFDPARDADKLLSVSTIRVDWDGPSNKATPIRGTAFGGESNFDIGGVSGSKFQLTLPFKRSYEKLPPVCTFEFDKPTESNEPMVAVPRTVGMPQELAISAFEPGGTLVDWTAIKTSFNAMCIGTMETFSGVRKNETSVLL